MDNSIRENKITDDKILAGINKKSFEIFYHGGSIWAEHLDGMGNQEALVLGKFQEDYKTFCRPSATSFIIINLDETDVTDTILTSIVKTICESTKQFKKIAFVGVGKSQQKKLKIIQRHRGIFVSFFKDYEKAKEWVLPK